jgi:YHS domain-containing protein
MSTAPPEITHTDTAGQVASCATSSATKLVQRLSVEVDDAEQRVRKLQADAARVFVALEKQFIRFLAVADRIHAILMPRLEALTTVTIFQDIEQSESVELRGPEVRGFHSRTTTLTVPVSEKHPAPMKFSFRVSHDGPMKNAVMEYRFEIAPIFIKLDSHDELIVPIDDPSEETISAWIDDKLVGFTRTYFEVYFSGEYQKDSLELDPVMNIRFPRVFAVGKTEYQGRPFHFYTEESLRAFKKAPTEYVASRDTSVGVAATNSE